MNFLRNKIKLVFCGVFYLVSSLSLLGGESPEVLIEKPWARPAKGPNGAAFMVLHSDDDILLEAWSPVCDDVELHTHRQEGSVMRMRPVDSIEIKGKTELKPGGLHLMLMGLHEPLKEGSVISITLKFEKAGEKKVQVPVQKSRT